MNTNAGHLISSQNPNRSSFVEPFFGEIKRGQGERYWDQSAVSQSSFNGRLRATNEIPEPYSGIFNGYPSFNGVQSTVFDSVISKDDSVVVTAPTGSGKTVIFELAMVKLLMQPNDGNFKIIYLAPVKALCYERLQDWNAKFSPLGLRCVMVTGDTDVDGDVTDLNNLQQYNLVLTTPEKWDFLTRRWRDYHHIMNSLRLFLIDEVHLLNDQSRGNVIEAVVSRMKMVQNQQDSGNSLRFVAVSATVANTPDVAAWLGTPSTPAICYEFGEETRPVKLNKVVKGYDLQATGFRFDLNLSYRVDNVLKEYAEGKPALIFCNTRKSVLQTADILSKAVKFSLSGEQKLNIKVACQGIGEGKLRELLDRGIGYHHAGMNPSDKNAVENVFRSGHLPVLVATSTLAMGVNLPAHLVILKNTQFYNQGKYEDYTDTQVLQMIGRAGRPQFDSSATAVIMTKPASVARYRRLVTGSDPVKSWLQNQIAEHLNAEIVLGSVRNLDDAVEWLKSTFYWICALKHPKQYGLPPNLTQEQMETALQDMIMKELHALEKYELVHLINNFETRQTRLGRSMARHYVSFDSMRLFLAMSGRESLAQLLDILTRCSELRDVTLRMHEKKPLNDLNAKDVGGLRFRIPGKITNRFLKINCLIQAVLGGHNLYNEVSLRQDSLRIVRVCQRLSRCLFEVAAEKGFMSGQRSAAILAKCLRSQLWEDSPMVARQLPEVGVALTQLLVHARKTTIDSLAEANPRELEVIMNRLPPMGDRVRNAAAAIPKLQVQLLKTGSDVMEVQITRIIRSSQPQRAPNPQNDHQQRFVLIVGGSDDKLLLQKRFAASDVGVPTNDDDTDASNAALSFEFYLKEPLPTKVHAFLISEMWVGLDSQATYVLKTIPGKENENSESELFHDAPADNIGEFCRLNKLPAPKKTPLPRSTPAPKKTPKVPKKTPAAPKQTPAAQPPRQTPTRKAPTNVNDIRRFFPAKKKSKTEIPQQPVVVISDSEDEELPMHLKTHKGIFDELREMELDKQEKSSPAVIVPPVRRPALESPQSATDSINPQRKFRTEEDERSLDMFEDFMAGAEDDVENSENDVEIIDGPTPPTKRPEPRSFGNDLTNMTLNQSNQPKILSTQQRHPSMYPSDRPNMTPIEVDVMEFEEISFDSLTSEDSPESMYNDLLSEKCEGSANFETAPKHSFNESGTAFSPGDGYSCSEDQRSGSASFDMVPKRSFNKSDTLSSPGDNYSIMTDHPENPRRDSANFETAPKHISNESYKMPYGYSYTADHRDSGNSGTEPTQSFTKTDMVTSPDDCSFMVDNRTTPHSDSPIFVSTPKISFNRLDIVSSPDYGYSYMADHEENLRSESAYFDTFDTTPSKDCYSFMTDHTRSQRSDSENFDEAPTFSLNSSDSVSYMEDGYSYMVDHTENQRSIANTTPKYSFNRCDSVFSQVDGYSCERDKRENPRNVATKFDSSPKYIVSRSDTVSSPGDGEFFMENYKENQRSTSANFDRSYTVSSPEHGYFYKRDNREGLPIIPADFYSTPNRSDMVSVQEYNSSFRTTFKENSRRTDLDAASRASNRMNMEYALARPRAFTDPSTFSTTHTSVTVKNDGELVMNMGCKEVPPTKPRRSFDKPTSPLLEKASERRSPRMAQTQSISKNSGEEIFPHIDIIPERNKRPEFTLEESYDSPLTNDSPGWDEQPNRSSSEYSNRFIGRNVPLRSSPPNIDKCFDEFLGRNSQDVGFATDLSQSDCSVRTEDSGFWSVTARRSQREDTPRKEAKSRKDIIEELGITHLLTGLKDDPGATYQVYSNLSQDLSQRNTFQVSSFHPTPWAKTKEVATNPFSQRTSTITRPEGVTHSYPEDHQPVIPWGTPRLNRLSKLPVPSNEPDHAQLAIDKVVANVKAAMEAEKQSNSNNFEKFKKKVRLEHQPAASTRGIPNMKPLKQNAKQALKPEIPESNPKAANNAVPAETEFSYTFQPESNGGQAFLVTELSPNPQLSKTDQKSSDQAISLSPPGMFDDVSSLPDKPDLTPIASKVSKPLLVAPEVSKHSSIAPNVSEPLPIASEVPKLLPIAPKVSEPLLVAPEVSKLSPIAPKVSEPLPIVPEVCKLPPIAPKVSEPLPMASEISKLSPIEPKVPESLPIAPEISKLLPIAPKVSEPLPIAPETSEFPQTVSKVTEAAPIVPKASSMLSQHPTSSKEMKPCKKPEPSKDTSQAMSSRNLFKLPSSVKHAKPSQSPIVPLKKTVFSDPKSRFSQSTLATITKNVQHSPGGMQLTKRRFIPPPPKSDSLVKDMMKLA